MSLITSTPAPVIRPKTSILDKSLSRGKQEVSLAAFALLFSEMVQYCQSRSSTVPELQQKLHDLGWQVRIFEELLNFLFATNYLLFNEKVGARILDLLFVRERASRRETKLLNVLLMVKSTLWKALFGKEADKLERANDDDKTYYIIEREPLVNRFISVPKDKVCLKRRKIEFFCMQLPYYMF